MTQQAPENPANHAPTRADEPAVGSPEEYEVLRRLLGVPAPVPEAREIPRASASEPEAPEPDAVSHEPATPVRKKPALPVRKAVVRRAAPAARPSAADALQVAAPVPVEQPSPAVAAA